MSRFQKAVKQRLKARIALCGPAGAGKTMTGLIFAKGLGEKVAVVDTEHGRAKLYADRYGFDVLELDSFSPQAYIDAIHDAEAEGYDVILIDSLSHAWMGKGGALEQVDQAAKRAQGNSYVGWRDVTPLHNNLIDTILASSCHIVATMRSKMDHVQEKDPKTGKTKITKVGMAPIQRDGMEYEFDLVADLDVDHNMIVTKSRCDALSAVVEKNPGSAFIAKFRAWLEDGEEAPPEDLKAAIRRQWNTLTTGERATLTRAAGTAGIATTYGERARDLASIIVEVESITAAHAAKDAVSDETSPPDNFPHDLEDVKNGRQESIDTPLEGRSMPVDQMSALGTLLMEGEEGLAAIPAYGELGDPPARKKR